jgi:hypothetical protein
LYSDEKDVEDAAEILRDYESEEQMRAQEEQAQEERLMQNYDFDRGDWIY